MKQISCFRKKKKTSKAPIKIKSYQLGPIQEGLGSEILSFYSSNVQQPFLDTVLAKLWHIDQKRVFELKKKKRQLIDCKVA